MGSVRCRGDQALIATGNIFFAYLVAFATVGTAVFACGCGSQSVDVPAGKVVAEVDGTPITEAELSTYLVETLGGFGAARMDEAGRKKGLEGLAATRVIAKARASELTEQESAELASKVAAYRDQLLVRDYLTTHAPPTPVTAAQIEAYYAKNKERFTSQTERSYELLLSDRVLSNKEQASLVQALSTPSEDAWAKRAATLRAQGLPMRHRTGVLGKAPLHPKLVQIARAMKVRQTSQVMFLQGKAFVLRVTHEKQLPAKTLQQASGEIRERLAPLQIKKSIAKIRAEAMKTAKVVYR